MDLAEVQPDASFVSARTDPPPHADWPAQKLQLSEHQQQRQRLRRPPSQIQSLQSSARVHDFCRIARSYVLGDGSVSVCAMRAQLSPSGARARHQNPHHHHHRSRHFVLVFVAISYPRVRDSVGVTRTAIPAGLCESETDGGPICRCLVPAHASRPCCARAFAIKSISRGSLGGLGPPAGLWSPCANLRGVEFFGDFSVKLPGNFLLPPRGLGNFRNGFRGLLGRFWVSGSSPVCLPR